MYAQNGRAAEHVKQNIDRTEKRNRQSTIKVRDVSIPFPTADRNTGEKNHQGYKRTLQHYEPEGSNWHL